MQTEKAIQLNNTLKTSINIFWAVYNQGKRKSIDKNEIDQFISSFEERNFDEYYDEFIEELKLNIEEYKDIELLDNYLESYFPVTDKLDNLDISLNKEIIRRNFEVKFLLTTRKKLQTELTKMWNIIYTNEGSYSAELKRHFEETMRKSDPDFKLNTEI